MDYSKLSDQEVNAVVAKKIGIQFDEEGPCIFDSSNIDSPYSDGEPVRFSFDPCNNPADAWPIIVNNKISVYAVGDDDRRGKWGAEGFKADAPYHFDDNPLRAAMICFLKMQESANVQDNPA